MAVKQIIPQRYTGGVNNVNQYVNTFASTWTSDNIPARICYAMKLKMISISLSVAPGGAASWTFDVLKNGSTCGMQIVISASGTTGTITGNVSFAEDDTINLRRVPASTPQVSTVTSVTWVWDQTAARTNNYPQLTASTSSTTGGGVLGWIINSATTSVQAPTAIPGTVTKYKVNLATSPGSGGDAFTFTLFKNEVAQDGTGGTPDTRVTITDAATSGQWSGTLSVVAGDRLSYTCVPVNSPANVGNYAICFGFEPTTDGYYQLLGGPFANMPAASGTTYNILHKILNDSWAAAETGLPITILGAGLSFVATALYARMSNTADNGQTFNLRKNSDATSQTCTIIATGREASDVTNQVTFSTNDTLSLQLVSAGSAGTARRGNVAIAILSRAAGGGAGAGHGSKGNKGGGGVNIQTPGGPCLMNFNPGTDVSTS